MKVTIHATGSRGNCASIEDKIIIDAGAKCNAIGEALFLTHMHTDHSKALKHFDGIPLYCTQETYDALKRTGKFAYLEPSIIEPNVKYRFDLSGEIFYVTAIRLKHDVSCVGYDIEHDGERIFFGTDFSEIIDDFDVRDYTEIFIECNNTLTISDMYAIDFDEEKPKDAFHRNRSYHNHCNINYLMSLFTRAGFSEDNPCDIPVTLLHRSSYYYWTNASRIEKLCNIANIVNPLVGATLCADSLVNEEDTERVVFRLAERYAKQ